MSRAEDRDIKAHDCCVTSPAVLAHLPIVRHKCWSLVLSSPLVLSALVQEFCEWKCSLPLS
jgi:hypothetical protein